MTIQELFIRSNQELQRFIDQITEKDWDKPMPQTMGGRPSTLAQSVAYHIYDDAWVPDVLAGKHKEEVAGKFDAILAVKKPRLIATYDQCNAIAIKAVQSFNDLDEVVHLSYGDFKAREYLQHITTFRAFRSYDIAKMIGAKNAMPEDFVQALWDEFSPHIEFYRQIGVFPPALKVSERADLRTKLLALVGRE